MLAAAELDAMAATLEESLPDSCAIVSGATVADGAGGQIPDPAAPEPATIACRVSPASELVRNAESIEAERIASQAPWIITVPRGTVIEPEDRITTGGRSFEVAAVLGPRSYPIALRVLCREVR